MQKIQEKCKKTLLCDDAILLRILSQMRSKSEDLFSICDAYEE